MADRIAHLGHSVASSFVWFNCLPLSVSPAVHLDQLG